MKTIAFGASYSKQSINKKFAAYTSSLFSDISDVEVLDLNDFPLPLFTVDLEAEIGYPVVVQKFIDVIQSADFFVISMTEHNGNFSAAFKNLFDWTSRVEGKIFEGKKLFLISTSPGGRGGKSSLEIAKSRFPLHGAEIVETFSLPKFYENFDESRGITNDELKEAFMTIVNNLKNTISS